MDLQTLQENWGVLCRKFPLVCALDLSAYALQDLKEVIKFYSVHFDHVIASTKDISQEDIKGFCSSERIINLTWFSSTQVPGKTLEDKIKNLLKGQMLLVISKKICSSSDMRWKLYDKVKEMKSPMTDVVNLDSQLEYCIEKDKISFTINLRLS